MSEKHRTVLLKINVSKISKERLFRGEKGVYLNAVMVDKKSEWGDDFVIFESVTKEERLKGTQGNIIGNGKFMPHKQDDRPEKKEAHTEAEGEDTVPF